VGVLAPALAALAGRLPGPAVEAYFSFLSSSQLHFFRLSIIARCQKLLEIVALRASGFAKLCCIYRLGRAALAALPCRKPLGGGKLPGPPATTSEREHAWTSNTQE